MPFLELEKQWDLRDVGTRPLSHTATDGDLSPALCGRTGQLLPSRLADRMGRAGSGPEHRAVQWWGGATGAKPHAIFEGS